MSVPLKPASGVYRMRVPPLTSAMVPLAGSVVAVISSGSLTWLLSLLSTCTVTAVSSAVVAVSSPAMGGIADSTPVPLRGTCSNELVWESDSMVSADENEPVSSGVKVTCTVTLSPAGMTNCPSRLSVNAGELPSGYTSKTVRGEPPLLPSVSASVRELPTPTSPKSRAPGVIVSSPGEAAVKARSPSSTGTIRRPWPSKMGARSARSSRSVVERTVPFCPLRT